MRLLLAALPLDVRKSSAFPSPVLLTHRGYAARRRSRLGLEPGISEKRSFSAHRRAEPEVE